MEINSIAKVLFNMYALVNTVSKFVKECKPYQPYLRRIKSIMIRLIILDYNIFLIHLNRKSIDTISKTISFAVFIYS